ncbi:MAG: hypothetical protein AB8B61_06810 [Cyclobacteriaceae bacterium]
MNIKSTKLIVLSIITLLVSVTACKDDNSVSLESISKLDSLTTVNLLASTSSSKKWSTQSFTFAGENDTCRLDDEITIYPNGTYTYDGGAILCGGPDSLKTKTGTWSFNFDDQRVVFTPDIATNPETTVEIVSLNDSIVTLKSSYLLIPITGTYKVK